MSQKAKEGTNMKLTGIDEFLQKAHPETFDFRDLMPEYYEYYKDKAPHDEATYNRLLEELKAMDTPDPVEKYRLYLTLGVGNAYQGCGKYFDCDNSNGTCYLTGEIYKTLWSREISSFCKRGDELMGATMNSLLTTLRALPEFKKGSDWITFHNQNEARSRLIFEKYPAVKRFIEVSHTLGNFTIWPTGNNSPRGVGAVKDYWDLTLNSIYHWYRDHEELLEKESISTNNDKLLYLVYSRIADFQSWLRAFGSWQNFVRLNYMQDFVHGADDESDAPDDGPFGAPKELWPGHFSGSVLPDGEQKEAQIQAFFTNASDWIGKRSARMVAALRKKRQ